MKTKVINDLVTKHIDIEKGEIFPSAREFLNNEEQDALVRQNTSQTRV